MDIDHFNDFVVKKKNLEKPAQSEEREVGIWAAVMAFISLVQLTAQHTRH